MRTPYFALNHISASRRGGIGLALILCLSGMPLAAQESGSPAVEPSAQGDLSVTIYNGDTALVRDVRQVDLSRGVNRIPFPDVSAQIRPETVTLSGTGFDILEQNFDYDLLSPAALMQKAVGQTVTLIRTNRATGAETRERAKILAVNGGVVMDVGGRIEVLRDDGLPVRVVFDAIPPNLRARPTLSITLDAASAGRRELGLSYLSNGLGWSADYVAMFDEARGTIDVQGWVTLTNDSGTTFTNARTLLVAGQVGQVSQGYNPGYPRGRGASSPGGIRPGTESGSREALGDFYLYPIDARTTIANAQQKQVSFLDVSGARASRGYDFRNAWLTSMDEAVSAASVLRFSSARQGGLGDALPAGTVRVYQRDARGNAQFIGESAIPHTPGGSELGLVTGQAFDVKVQPVVEERSRITADQWRQSYQYRIDDGEDQRTVTVSTKDQLYRTKMRYTVTNARNVPVTVTVYQSGLDGYYAVRDTRVPQESIKGEQVDSDTRRWQVQVPANGETVLTATFETRY